MHPNLKPGAGKMAGYSRMDAVWEVTESNPWLELGMISGDWAFEPQV